MRWDRGAWLFTAILVASLFAACSRHPTEPAEDTLPPQTITDLTVLTTSDTSIFLTWTAPGDGDGKRPVRLYEVRQSLDPQAVHNWIQAVPVPNSLTPHGPGLPETLEVNRLVPRLTYHFGVKSMDASGNHSGVSNVVGSDIGDRIPPALVQDLRITSIGSSTLNLVWTAPGDDGMMGVIRTYDIRYGREISTEIWDGLPRISFTRVPNPAGAEENLEIRGITSATNYDYALRAIDDAGNKSQISNVVSGKTLADVVPPASVTDLSIIGITAHSVTLQWTAPGDDNSLGTVDSYDLRYATFPIDAGNWDSAEKSVLLVIPKSVGQMQTTGIYYLATSTEYYFALVSKDEAGNRSGLSNRIVATTKATGSQWLVSQLGDFPTIQSALDYVAAGDIILVAPDRYYECLDFGNKDVEVRSEAGPEATLIVGCGVAGKPLIHFGSATTRNTVFEGFTLSGAQNAVAIRIDVGSPNILNNVFRDNSGTAIDIRGGDAVVKNNTFRNNGDPKYGQWGTGVILAAHTGPDGIPADWGEPIVEGNLFENNQAGFGAGIYVATTNAKILNNVFRNNQCSYDGGAIFMWPSCDHVLIENNQFIENIAGDHGGGIAAWSYQNYEGVSWVDIHRNLFQGNEARGLDSGGINGVGGAIHVSGLQGTITENTVVRNRASPLCGGSGITFYIDARFMPNPVGPWIVERNIIAYNLEGGITCTMGAEDYAKNNLLFQNGHDFGCGNGLCDSSVVRDNWVGDPMFCDPDAGDWHVNENSPAILNPIGSLGAFPVPGCGTQDVSRTMQSRKQ